MRESNIETRVVFHTDNVSCYVLAFEFLTLVNHMYFYLVFDIFMFSIFHLCGTEKILGVFVYETKLHQLFVGRQWVYYSW